MGLELLADEVGGRLHVAVVRGKTVDNLYIDRLDAAAAWGSLYLGRVVKTDAKLDAAIVDLGGGRQGILPAKHARAGDADESAPRAGIANIVKPGQPVLVQVKSEAKREALQDSRKLPRLTARLCILGQHLVHCPLSARVSASRRVSNGDILRAARALKGAGGWMVHSSAQRAREEDIAFESRALLSEWRAIQDAREAGGDAPRLLRQGPTALCRALFDYGSGVFDHIYVGNKALLAQAQEWCARHQPDLAASKRLRLFRPARAGERLFDMHDIYSELAVLQDPVVPLDSGGSIVIENTHAVTVIDVNQGASGGASIANREAAREVARQTRLRNLSGAILVDFINMHKKAERDLLVETLEETYGDDHALAQVHGFTRLGIVEITRKRRVATVAETLSS